MNPEVHNPGPNEEELDPLESQAGTHSSVRVESIKNRRIFLFYILFAGMFLYLLAGQSWRQLIQASDYEEKGERQSKRRILQPALRGDIYDRHGRLIVGNRPRHSAVVYLEGMRDELRKEYYKQVRLHRERDEKISGTALLNESRVIVLQRYLDTVNEIIGRNEQLAVEDISRHYGQRLLLPFPLIEDLKPEEYAKLIEQLPVNSPVQIFTKPARYYPYGSAAAHTLGYVKQTVEIPEEGVPGEHLITLAFQGLEGVAGLERYFDEALQGTTGGEVWLVDLFGYQFKREEKLLPTRGDTIQCSLDIELQQAAEQALGVKRGAVVAIDIPTGEILALASKPAYDLNDLSGSFIPQSVVDDINARGAWVNRATQGRYPPASTFKLITAIAGMRAGVIDPDELIQCDAVFRIGNRPFREHGGVAFGQIDMREAIQISSNVYFYQQGLRTGVDTLAAEARRFGLGQDTGVELPAESSGLVPTPEWKENNLYGERWVAGDTVNMSVGQGFLSATPLQMAAATASIARRETRTRVTLLHDPYHTIDHGGEPLGLTDYQYNALIDGMLRVTGPGGTGRRIAINGVEIAAKTGTGEFRSDNKDLTVAWAVAFAPVDDPKIAIAVLVEGTQIDDVLWGGSTAGPIAHYVLRTYFE